MNASKLEVTTRTDGTHYLFGAFHLRPDGSLQRNGSPVHLPPKELTALRLLLTNAGDIVSPAQLRSAIWGTVHVSADSLPRCISSLRALLESEDCIQTLYKRGYRFMLPVKQDEPELYRGVERRQIRPLDPPRLAILPFETSLGVPPSFGPGIAEETMLRLSRARVPAADLIARDSVFALAARGASAQEIGATLAADLALTGSIAAFPKHFRLRIEMIRVAGSVQLWVEEFLIPRDLLAYADSRAAKRITARIRNAFASPIRPALTSALDSVSTADAGPAIGPGEAQRSEAYRIYLQACEQWNGLGHDLGRDLRPSSDRNLDRTQMQEAMEKFQLALDRDPLLADARSRLIHGSLCQSSYGYLRSDVAAELALKQAEIALAISGPSPFLYSTLGWIHFHHNRDLAAATTSFVRSHRPPVKQGNHAALHPNPFGRIAHSSWNVLYQARFALGRGLFAEGIALLQSALSFDPYSPAFHARLAWAHHLAGDSFAAVEQARVTQTLFPNHPEAQLFCSIVFAAGAEPGDGRGELATQATSLATKLVQGAPTLDAGYANLAYIQARQGRIIEARTLLDRQQQLARERFVMRSFDVPALIELGEMDAAMKTLVNADQQHCSWLFELLVDPRLKPLRGEPEFERLCQPAREIASASSSVA